MYIQILLGRDKFCALQRSKWISLYAPSVLLFFTGLSTCTCFIECCCIVVKINVNFIGRGCDFLEIVTEGETCARWHKTNLNNQRILGGYFGGYQKVCVFCFRMWFKIRKWDSNMKHRWFSLKERVVHKPVLIDWIWAIKRPDKKNKSDFFFLNWTCKKKEIEHLFYLP